MSVTCPSGAISESRLKAIAHHAGINPYQRRPRLTLRSVPLQHLDDDADNEVHDLLIEAKWSRPGFKHPDQQCIRSLLRTKGRQERLRWDALNLFHREDFDDALDVAVIYRRSPLCVIQSLLNNGARFRYPEHLEAAVSQNNALLTTLILSKPSHDLVRDWSLDALLSTVCHERRQGHITTEAQLETLSALVAGNACISSLYIEGSHALVKLVEERHLDLVQLALRSPSKVQSETIRRCLVIAVRNKDVDMVATLLAYGALTDIASLRAAIDFEQYEVAVRLLAHADHLPKSKTLTTAVQHMLERISSDDDHDWLELFLEAGAWPKHECLTGRLATAVEYGDKRTCALLLNFGVCVSLCRYQPLRRAIAQRDLPMLKDLLHGRCRKRSCISAAADLVPTLRDHFTDQTDEVQATILIRDAGARGKGFDQRLVTLVNTIVRSRDASELPPIQQKHVRTLMNAGATFEYNQGEAFKAAVTSEHLHLVDTACRTIEDTAITSTALLSLYENGTVWSGIRDKARLLACLLDAKATPKKQALNKALEHSIRGRDPALHLGMLLIEKGAQVTSPELLVQVTRNVNDQTYKSLLNTIRTGSDILTHTLTHVLAISLTKARLILEKGCSQGARDRALISELETKNSRIDALRLLLDHGASVDCDGGRPLQLAFQMADEPIISMLLNRRPAQRTVDAALCVVAKQSRPERRGHIELLLSQKLSQASLDCALLSVVQCEGQEKTEVVRLLLAHGSNASYRGGDTLRAAVKVKDHEVLKVLLATSPPPTALDTALRAAFKHPATFETNIIEALLDSGANKTDAADLLLAQATTASNVGIIKLCLHYDVEYGTQTAAAASTAASQANELVLSLLVKDHSGDWTEEFDALRSETTSFVSAAGLQCLKLFLTEDVDQGSRDQALLDAVTACSRGYACYEHVHTLLGGGADVDGCDGNSLAVAARMQPLGTYIMLLRSGPSQATVTRAVAHLLSTKHPETEFLASLNASFAVCPGGPDEEADGIGESSIIALAVRHYPDSREVFHRLFQHGFRAPQSMLVKPSPYMISESATFLSWCATHVKNAHVLQEIIAKQDVNAPSTNHYTPLMIAVLHANQICVDLLVQQGNLDTNRTDIRGRTALFYAAILGYAGIARSICAVKPSCDDESLHEAVRMLNADIVEILLQAGHSASHVGPLHAYRTPLFEMLKLSTISDNVQYQAAMRIILALLGAGADLQSVYEGKTAVFVTFHSEKPTLMLAALLYTTGTACLVSWDSLYTTPDGLCYSPTMYLKCSTLPTVSAKDKAYMLQMLYQCRCQDRLFRPNGEQPAGAVGLPPEVEERICQENLRQAEHARNIELANRERAAQEEKRRAQEATARRNAERHRLAEAAKEQEIERARAESAARIQQKEVAHQRELQKQAQAQQQELDFRAKKQNIDLDALERGRKIDSTHAKEKAQIRKDEREHRTDQDLRQLRAEDDVNANQHKRQLERMDRASEVYRLQATLGQRPQAQLGSREHIDRPQITDGTNEAHEADDEEPD